MIEKLKANERQSDLARLTGIDDGEEEMNSRPVGQEEYETRVDGKFYGWLWK